MGIDFYPMIFLFVKAQNVEFPVHESLLAQENDCNLRLHGLLAKGFRTVQECDACLQRFRTWSNGGRDEGLMFKAVTPVPTQIALYRVLSLHCELGAQKQSRLEICLKGV